MNAGQPFEQVVQRYAGTVLRVCRAVLGSHADAEDAWSETFLSAMKAWPELPAAANVEAWLVTIAHRKALDIVRSRRRRPTPLGELPEPVAEAGTQDSQVMDAWDAVRELPEKQRLVIAYRYLGGLSYQDIAEILGGSVDSARRAAADGMKSLRRDLADAPSKGAQR